MTANEPDWQSLAIEAGRLFTPNTPVSERDLFSGRVQQIRRTIDVILQKGQHAIIFGERGVGKTSLANVLASFVPSQKHNLLSVRINCDRADTFETVWQKVFDEIHLIQSTASIGFQSKTSQTTISALSLFGDSPIGPDAVRRALVRLSIDVSPIVILDEFDRLPEDVRRLFSDLIKNLSDHSIEATVILIGVGDSVDQLIREHQSVSRALVQVPMPRMSNDETRKIIEAALKKIGMDIEKTVLDEIITLSQGLPHYVHLTGLHATRNALDNHSLKILQSHLKNAIRKALDDAQQSIRTQYHTAVRSAHKDNLFEEVLLACALSHLDEIGTFAAQDVKAPLHKITHRHYDIPAFARHLTEFCEDKRGTVLVRIGEKRKYRYKFADPLMQPYVIMQGVAGDMIPVESVDA